MTQIYRTYNHPFDVNVTVHRCYNKISNQLDATITVY